MTRHFNDQNSDFTTAQQDWANARVSALLAEWDDPDGENPENVKSASDRANNEMPAGV